MFHIRDDSYVQNILELVNVNQRTKKKTTVLTWIQCFAWNWAGYRAQHCEHYLKNIHKHTHIDNRVKSHPSKYSITLCITNRFYFWNVVRLSHENLIPSWDCLFVWNSCAWKWKASKLSSIYTRPTDWWHFFCFFALFGVNLFETREYNNKKNSHK